ncbi:MAG: TonB-dependent receptor [Muribaculaceae bacterium]|nr:TonB-dependent receptor [Muribaculaceae bacterium]
MKNEHRLLHSIALLLIFIMTSALAARADTVKGTVVDDTGEPLIGVTVMVVGVPGGTVTDLDGNYSIDVPNIKKNELRFTYVGMETLTVKVNSRTSINVELKSADSTLDELVVVGYGQQKKASVVGAIVQTSGETLARSGGVSNLGAALTGNLPGVTTIASSGMPGDEDPKIVIRGQTSWNGSDPLVLVDGVEREMSSVDISSVASVSVLKDASATAVYGVKGANGVILITTKRGSEGAAQVHARANFTAKVPSKLPEKYDAYDSYLLRNQAIERELSIPGTNSWGEIFPLEVLDKFRNPANSDEWDQYPNVDWADYLFKDVAFSQNVSVDVSGGTKFVKYYAAIDFLHEGDIFKRFDNHRGYSAGFGFTRVNARSNLDFQLTPTTTLRVNLFGSNGGKQSPYGRYFDDPIGADFWSAAYKTAPGSIRPIYSDGTWGFYAPRNADVPNSAYNLSLGGVEKKTTTRINTDFVLSQDLKFVTPGLRLEGRFSLDYSFLEGRRGIVDLDTPAQRKWVDPATGQVSYAEPVVNSGSQLDFAEGVYWTTQGGEVNKGYTFRKIYYSVQADYNRTFGDHEVGLMGVFSREDYARGSEFHHYREDWVVRATYNYDFRYFAEFNGAYNGSEKYGSKNRFDFFPSVSLGWRLSGEHFMERCSRWLSQLKFRASWGKVGDDSAGGRWLYRDQFAYGGNVAMGMVNPASSPYAFYRISQLGNPDISWEKVTKKNLGIEFGFLNNIISGNVDLFADHRSDIYIAGGDRAIPSYFGTDAPGANLGIVDSKGYELELRFNYPFNHDTRLWLNASMTHATNEVKFRDDKPLLPSYRKQEGYAIGQNRDYIDYGTMSTWDDIMGSTETVSNNSNKLPGDYMIVDFNGDGVIDTNDLAPVGFSSIPQNTYNATLGFEWKGLSAMIQFYGVNNVTREVTFPTFQNSNVVAYVEGTYWTPGGSGLPMPRWETKTDPSARGTRYSYDGSYVRLKNAEISYNFPKNIIGKIGLSGCRVFVNGDNLWLWTKMPDDREANLGGYGSTNGAYPTVRRFNLGLDITL